MVTLAERGQMLRVRRTTAMRRLYPLIERYATSVGTVSITGETEIYRQAKDEAIERWERLWIERLLLAHDHDVSRVARAATMARSHLRELCQRYGIRARADTEDT